MKKKYKIDYKCLGSGSFGKVFAAVDQNDSSIKIAVKVINKNGMSKDDLTALESEVAIMQQVDHPNIVKYFETYDDKKYIYLCMELLGGGELFQKVLESGHTMKEKEAAEVYEKILKAMLHCHSQNIIHRDIKPENIMYGSEGNIKIIDFGFALVSAAKKAELDVAGTPYYIAPEVLTGKYGKACDIWSLGVVLYQLLTGEHVFDGRS